MKIETDPKERGGKTVLIVEDNAMIRKMIADAFLSDGFKICGVAENGKVAGRNYFGPLNACDEWYRSSV